ncbi:MAG: hypothetical protein JO023_28920 [Chloroflexi bacterium]|nr:hypothetical protein [Chloroflexota bacterium]
MQLWLLVVGVVVLVMIAFWLVSRAPEGSEPESTEEESIVNGDLNPTSEPRPSAPVDRDVAATEAIAEQNAAAARDAAMAAETGATSYGYGDMRAYAPGGYSEQASGMSIGKSLAIGGLGAVAACGVSAVVWTVVQRRREDNKPINRARRQLEGWGSQLRSDERVAPAGGASALALVGSVLLARALMANRDRSAAEAAAQAAPAAQGIAAAGLKTAAAALTAAAASLQAASENPPNLDLGMVREMSRHLADSGSDRWGAARESVGAAPVPAAPMGVGIGGLAVLGAAAYLIWRLLNRPEPQPQTWHIEPSRQ